MFTDGEIQGVVIRDLKRFADDRGWLMELFREDETKKEFIPVMGYLSVTRPDVARGPHEHEEQADYFFFLGPSTFRIYLWDNRKISPTYMTRNVVTAGESSPKGLIIPPGVVHAYRNIGAVDGVVINCPNRLYAGPGRKDPVDEIRHEDDSKTIYRLD